VLERAKITDAALKTLRRCELCHGLSSDELRRIGEAARPLSVASGEVISREGQKGHSLYIVARGRVKVLNETATVPQLVEYQGPGDHFGDLAVLGDGLQTATRIAVVDTELLELDRDHFERLLMEIPALAVNLSRAVVHRWRHESNRRHRRRGVLVVGAVATTPASHEILRSVAEGLAVRGDSVVIITDDVSRWPANDRFSVETIPIESDSRQRAARLDDRVHRLTSHRHRVLVELTEREHQDRIPELLATCEQVWWVCEAGDWDDSRRRLRELLALSPALASRVHLVWALGGKERFAPRRDNDLGIASLDFKVVLDGEPSARGRQYRHGVARLVRYVRGTRVALALGGGGARGLAHLGVLRALDREGIDFDLLAGTSVGALTGLSYAGGWTPQMAIDLFTSALTPRWPLRHLPGGPFLYMWAMYRWRCWDGMLRPYLGDSSLEQLQVPLTTVTLDLVSGRQVARDRGDAIHAVMESINLPVIARPILRDGMALIDGGVLNNVPADTLPERGADFIVGVDVVTKLTKAFPRPKKAGRSGTPRPNVIETALRMAEVQAYGITALRATAVDLMIAPDTSEFDFVDFSRGHELAEIGDRAASEALPRLKQSLADFERFRAPGITGSTSQ